MTGNSKGYFMFSKICKTATAALCLMSGPALADWSANLISVGADSPGATGEIECAPNGAFGTVWGTGTYTSDSSICTAAVHYGWINRGEGGVVSYRQVPGLGSYPGSAQNGVTTFDYGSWSSSFQLIGMTPIGGGATTITWNDNPDTLGVSGAVGETLRYTCLGDASVGGTIWGTDVYTSDSPICIAAQHRGHVTPQSGGTVSIMILGSQPAYTGSSRNGIGSSDYPEWGRSYVFQ